jgi:hypothetical protein
MTAPATDMKNLSLASVLLSASAQSCTTARVELATTRTPLMPYLSNQGMRTRAHVHKQTNIYTLTRRVRHCCQELGVAETQKQSTPLQYQKDMNSHKCATFVIRIRSAEPETAGPT